MGLVRKGKKFLETNCIFLRYVKLMEIAISIDKTDNTVNGNFFQIMSYDGKPS
jgi:hypothetical protein